jgi:hypothetical protein
LIGSSRTECTRIYEDLPEEPQEPADRAKILVKSPIPCPQKIVEPEPTTSNPKPFSEDHQPLFFSMFDDDESTVDDDVSSLPREESDAYGESEVPTLDFNEESLPNTEQGKEDSPFHTVEFQFSKEKFEFSDEEFKSPISPCPSELQEYQCLDPFSDSEETYFLLDPKQSKDFHIKGIDATHEYYTLEHDV